MNIPEDDPDNYTKNSIKQWREHLAKKRDWIVHLPDKGVLLLRFDTPYYEIPLNDINSPTDLLRWTLHLTEKNWINPEHLACFIQKVASIKGFNLYPSD
jgi:hypothetical protein